MKLSGCMIVKNEADRLSNCLQSLQGIIDELVILDTGSTDETPKIAQQWGAKVYQGQWHHDFALARNTALQYVTGDWVLVLDADETFVPERRTQLRKALLSRETLVINLIRQEVGASQSPYSMVSRLFRNHPQLHFSRPYHALIDDSVIQLLSAEPHWKITTLPEVAILHEGYQKQAINQGQKWQKALEVMEQYYHQHPQDPYTASKLGGLYIEQGKIHQGIQILEAGLSLLQDSLQSAPSTNQQAVNTRYELHYHLGIGYHKQQNLPAAQAHYQGATEINILPRLKLGAYNNLGNVLKEMGDLMGAKIAYEIALQIDPNLAITHYNLGMTLRALGQYRPAIAAYRQAIKLNPNGAEVYQNLGVVLLQAGQIMDSRAAFQQAIVLYEQNHSPEAQRLRQALQEMGINL